MRRVSFRDPAGFVTENGDRIERRINPSGVTNLEAYSESAAIKGAQARGEAIHVEQGTSLNGQHRVTSRRILFPNYPHEWPAEMLHDAARLTLDLSTRLLAEGRGLKDATPTNIIFEDHHPVFIDILSVEAREATDPTWLPYGQFVRTFLLPLLLRRACGIPSHETFLAHRDGVTPDEAWARLSKIQRLSPTAFALATAPRLLGKRPSQPTRERRAAPDRAHFTLERLYLGLHRHLRHVQSKDETSTWSSYRANLKHYSQEEAERKEDFVRRALRIDRPKWVLDVGANDGNYSRIAAESGASVVAIDNDHVVVGHLWRDVRAEDLAILPLVVDIARPTPSIGWRNGEAKSFLERARGHFDATLLLAVVHHLAISESIPMSEIMELASELTTKTLLIEQIKPSDPMAIEIARTRSIGLENLDEEDFRMNLERHFEVIETRDVGPHRRVHWCHRKRGAA